MEIRAKHLFFLALLLACVSASLYSPWRDNPLVFDDPNILRSTALFDYAQVPFSLVPRQFPYFTLGLENVISGGNLRISRYVSLLLHALNAFLLFMLGRRLLRKIISPARAFVTAAAIAIIFVVHPVAVYAVGYLVQRTILFATFFLLLSAWQFDKALSALSWPRAVWAGVCFGLAALSKEHALTGFIGVIGIVFVNKDLVRQDRFGALVAFVATALPVALWVASLKLGLVGVAYEPDAQDMVSALDFPDQGSRLGNWMLSASLQCLFFFRYFGFWWWPDPSGLSVDIRPDFGFLAHSYLVIAGPIAIFALAGLLVFSLVSSKVRPEVKLAAFGLFWALSLFFVELSTVRFQEAIVLYRSYLWAPGFLLSLAGLMSMLPARWVGGIAVFAVVSLIPLTWQRLSLFSDELSLWQEAAQKLPQETCSGAVRIHYNLGVFHSKKGQMAEALADFNWVIRQDPHSFHGYWGRSSVYLYNNELLLAQDDLETVIRLKPDFGMAYFQSAILLKNRGKLEESESAFTMAEKFGVPRINFN